MAPCLIDNEVEGADMTRGLQTPLRPEHNPMPKIRTIRVTNGVFWIEIPEVGLNILCGCPEDAIKHLIRRHLTATVENDGVRYETGPNAILLSDLLIQNGSFANLAEFPVLHMLYRQGMLVPNHPNFGKKPLLLGSDEQVKAQMRYIYRGNYGLTSEQELVEAGISVRQATEIMLMKHKFAFNNIRPPNELLDTLIVKSGPAEVTEGVTVRRVRLNVFDFRYQTESVRVDLNLAANERYEPPYQLGFHLITREYFGVVHCGEGNGWDVHRPCMSSILIFKGKLYLIDAGPNLLHSLTALGISINEIEGIFHTHAHDDHFAGLPSLIRSGRRIKYYATALVRASVTKKLFSLLPEGEQQFSDFFEVHDLEFDTWNDIDGLQVKPAFSPHPVETNVFFFRAPIDGGFRSYAHLADIISLRNLKNMIATGKADRGISPRFYSKIKETYTTPANLKKVDIGGGMIHGAAVDFQDDKSEKLILSHTERNLTDEEGEIGCCLAFGAADVLIHRDEDYLRRSAGDFLRSYFTDLSRDRLRNLLNNRVITFKPGGSIYKKGETINELFLLLTGSVEMVQSNSDSAAMLCPGSLIGENAPSNQFRSPATYRAVGFARAIVIPLRFYVEFFKNNALGFQLEESYEKRTFLQKTYLFGEAICHPTLNEIAQSMQLHHYRAGEVVSKLDHSFLSLVEAGTMERLSGDKLLGTVSQYDFFGEESVFFHTPPIYSMSAFDDVSTYRIPVSIFRHIPIVRWKLIEAYEKRRQA
jgi:hemerythrin